MGKKKKKDFRRRVAEAYSATVPLERLIETPQARERRRVAKHEARRDRELKRLGWDSYEEFKRGAEEFGRRLGIVSEKDRISHQPGPGSPSRGSGP